MRLEDKLTDMTDLMIFAKENNLNIPEIVLSNIVLFDLGLSRRDLENLVAMVVVCALFLYMLNNIY